MQIIDAHAHLWKKQNGRMGTLPVTTLKNGQSDVAGTVRQMMPPYMIDGGNTAEVFLSNMDYAGVCAAVITQEVLDGNQNAYLKEVRRLHPNRFRVCSYYDDGVIPETDGFDGIKLCACKLKNADITHYADVFETARQNGMFVAVELKDGDAQTASLYEMIRQFPTVPIVIGHFGMVTRSGWEEQIKLAREPNVYVESGGITWLFHSEFYPYPSAVKAIRTAADICGMEKLMWGSDYPRTMTEITYKMSFDFILKSNGLTPEEKRLFLFENAEKMYGFKDLPDITPVMHMLD